MMLLFAGGTGIEPVSLPQRALAVFQPFKLTTLVVRRRSVESRGGRCLRYDYFTMGFPPLLAEVSSRIDLLRVVETAAATLQPCPNVIATRHFRGSFVSLCARRAFHNGFRA